jgi:hypothetical protein
MYDTTYTYSTDASSTAAAGVLGAFFMVYLIVVLIVAVVGIVALWKTFVKAGNLVGQRLSQSTTFTLC